MVMTITFEQLKAIMPQATAGNIKKYLPWLNAWMPNAILIIATPLSGRGTTGQLNQSNVNLDEYQKSVNVRRVANIFSIPVIDVNSECGINGLNRTTYINDQVHPTLLAGQKMLARTIIGGLKRIMPNL